MLAWAALAGCRPDVALRPYGGWPLWFPLDLDGAQDLGHTPERLDRPEPGPLTFVDEAVERGLGGAVAGGNQHGVAVALVDVDGDGDPDAVFANGAANRSPRAWRSSFWRNEGGTFVEDRGALGGHLDGLDTYSLAAGDVDGDGAVDLYVGAQPVNVLLHNRGHGTFDDVTARAGAAAARSDPRQVRDGRGKVVAIDDVDGDGALDLLTATSTQPAPGATLLRNRGDGTFDDVTRAFGATIASSGNPCAVLLTDYDNDGRRDAWIWNDRGGHTLLHHDGEGWEDFGSAADLVDIRNAMGIDGADIDADGDVDYYVGNIGPHPLLLNQGTGSFIDLSRAAGTTGEYGWGIGFRDFDLDSRPDLLVTQEDSRPTLLYRNRDGERFERTERPGPPLTDPGDAHNVPAAFGDVDGDGLTDVLIARTDGSRPQLLRNVTDVGGRLALEVEAPVGSRVVVGVGDEVWFQDVHGGSSRASQSELVARFGLGDWTGVDYVVVALPGGGVNTFTGVPAGRLRAP